MIEIKIKIEEKEAKEIKNKLAKRIECQITQEGKNYTIGEKEVEFEELLNKLFSL